MRRIFWGFCRNWFLIDPLHYLSSRSDFGFEFTEAFVIEKRIPDSAFKCSKENSASQGVAMVSRDQPFKRSIWQKRSQGCNVLSPITIDLFKGLKTIGSQGNLVDSLTRRVGESFSITNTSENRNGSKRSVRDLCRTGLCKNPR
jgi:hypothetical protein